MRFLETLRSASGMLFAPQLRNQATNIPISILIHKMRDVLGFVQQVTHKACKEYAVCDCGECRVSMWYTIHYAHAVSML